MDGCPYKGEVIPIRLYLSGVDLTPSYKQVNGKFEVKHFLNLILVDEEDRRYFKQHEVEFYRKK
jgi:vacuolar protein sorting-associated protein 26